MKNLYYFFTIAFLLVCTALKAATITSTPSGGNWSATTTWVGGSVPTGADDVVIAALGTVTIDINDVETKNLTIAGTLSFFGASNLVTAITINGNLLVDVGGLLNAYNNVNLPGKSVIVKGNVVNNGGMEFSNGSGAVTGPPAVAETMSNLVMGESAGATSISGTGNFSVFRQLTIDNSFGVELDVPISISYRLNLTHGEFRNGTNLSLNHLSVGIGPAAGQCRIQRSQTSSLATPYLLPNNSPLYIYYTENPNQPVGLITEGNEMASRGAIFVLSIDNTGGVQINEDLTLRSSGSGVLGLSKGVLTLATGKTITILSLNVNAAVISPGVDNSRYVLGGGIAVTVGTTAMVRQFPLGNAAGMVKRVIINGLSTTTGTSVVRISLEAAGDAQTGVSTARRWLVTANNTNAKFTSMSIVSATDERIEGIAPDVIVVAPTLNGAYTNLSFGSSSNTLVTSAAGTFNTTGYFGLAKQSILPVSLLSFVAKANQNGVEISWSTAQEIQNSSFEVERSLDGISYIKIAKVNGKGNTVSQTDYTSYDTKPLTGNNYYRLVQYDDNGSQTIYFDKISVVNFNLSAIAKISVYPNPTTDKINITLPNNFDRVANIILRDVTGKVIYKITDAKMEDGYQLNLSNKPVSGIYFLEVNSNSFAEKLKVIIN